MLTLFFRDFKNSFRLTAQPKAQSCPYSLEQRSAFRAESTPHLQAPTARERARCSLVCLLIKRRRCHSSYTPCPTPHAAVSAYPSRAVSAVGVADTEETDTSLVPRPGASTFIRCRGQKALCGATAPGSFQRPMV